VKPANLGIWVSFDLTSIIDYSEEIKKYKDPMVDNNTSCFIATACYGDCDALEVLLFRRYRDETLLKTLLGRLFVSFYYYTSPMLAGLIAKSERLKFFVRRYLLQPLLVRIERRLK
jgi:hypothetical protein